MKKPMRYLAILSIISLLFSCSSKDQALEITVSEEKKDTRKESGEQDELKHYNDSMIASSKELSTIKAFIDSTSKYYDSIPYTFKYKGQRYYMPVAELSQEKDVVHYKKIGLVNSKNEVIIPIEYDRIYTPNTLLEGVFEVTKNNKNGLIDIAGKIIVPANYDIIYPGVLNYKVLLENSEGLSVLTNNHDINNLVGSEKDIAISALYSSSAIGSWGFDVNIELPFSQTLNLLNFYGYEEEGSGTFYPPSYLTSLGLISEELSYVIVDSTEWMGSANIKTQVQAVSSNNERGYWSLISEFFREMPEARGYKEERKIISTVNNKGVKNHFVYTHEKDFNLCHDSLYFKQLNDSIYEFRNAYWGNQNLPKFNSIFQSYEKYTYVFIEANGKIRSVESDRLFPFTGVTKIDSTYFIGCWRKYLEENPKEYTVIKYDHLTLEDLDYMRNEIFASYGYKFKSEKWDTTFQKKKWYKAKLDNVDDKLTEIEKTNIKYILEYKKRMLKRNNGKVKTDSLHWSAAG